VSGIDDLGHRHRRDGELGPRVVGLFDLFGGRDGPGPDDRVDPARNLGQGVGRARCVHGDLDGLETTADRRSDALHGVTGLMHAEYGDELSVAEALHTGVEELGVHDFRLLGVAGPSSRRGGPGVVESITRTTRLGRILDAP
jgi:hypothetical protein